MHKIVLAGAAAVSISVGFSWGAFAQASSANQGKACEAVFDKNEAAIDSMAAAGNTAGIRGIFTKSGCPAPQVNVAKQPVSAGKELAKVKCTFKLIPPTIECIFGAVGIPVRPNSD